MPRPVAVTPRRSVTAAGVTARPRKCGGNERCVGQAATSRLDQMQQNVNAESTASDGHKVGRADNHLDDAQIQPQVRATRPARSTVSGAAMRLTGRTCPAERRRRASMSATSGESGSTTPAGDRRVEHARPTRRRLRTSRRRQRHDDASTHPVVPGSVVATNVNGVVAHVHS